MQYRLENEMQKKQQVKCMSSKLYLSTLLNLVMFAVEMFIDTGGKFCCFECGWFQRAVCYIGQL